MSIYLKSKNFLDTETQLGNAKMLSNKVEQELLEETENTIRNFYKNKTLSEGNKNYDFYAVKSTYVNDYSEEFRRASSFDESIMLLKIDFEILFILSATNNIRLHKKTREGIAFLKQKLNPREFSYPEFNDNLLKGINKGLYVKMKLAIDMRSLLGRRWAYDFHENLKDVVEE